MGLLIPQRASPQMADKGTLTNLLEGTGEIKYPGWTKISETHTMDKTLTEDNIPGGSPGINLENPPSKAGFMDSGEGQPLFVENSIEESLMLNSSSASISKKTESQKVNYFAEWQK